MTPTPPPLDIVTVAIALLSVFFGANIAVVLGPYAVILLAAIGGASWSLASRPATDTRPAVLHMLLMVGLALIGTVPLAEGVARLFGLEARWMFAPVSVVIAARPDWIISRLRSLLDRRTGNQDGGAT